MDRDALKIALDLVVAEYRKQDFAVYREEMKTPGRQNRSLIQTAEHKRDQARIAGNELIRLLQKGS